MEHVRHQYLFLANPHDLLGPRDMEKRHHHFQPSTDHRQHNYVLPHHLAFQHPFAHQQIQSNIPQMVPQHFPHDFSFGLPYVEAMPHGLMEHDDSNEPTTRPRLTKEQVDFFEREFAANSKPPSTYKRALALQTNIDYNRISNWFQNRRAKAKQQKKQEEFEKSQRKQRDEVGDMTPQPTAEEEEEEDDDDEEEERHKGFAKGSESPKLERKERSEHTTMADDRRSVVSATSSAPSQSSSPTRSLETTKEKGWASLQRALAAARAANPVPHQVLQHQQQQQDLHQQHHVNSLSQPLQIMLPPRLPTRTPMNEHVSLSQVREPNPKSSMMNFHSQIRAASETHSDKLGWQSQPVTSSAWPTSTINASEMHFDFGFHHMGSSGLEEGVELISPTDTSSQNVMLSADSWDSSLVTPTMPPPMTYSQPVQSPGLSLPAYDQSRRGSLADGLSANFENFDVDGESPSLDDSPTLSLAQSIDYDANRTDLAARRKRPVPALAIRSHSYGAPTAKSPTCRPSIAPPATHSLRHSKSAGHGLSSYAGVRKSSIASKSPLGLSFEGNNLDRLMAQNTNDINLRQPLMPVSANSVGSRHMHEQMLASFQTLSHNRMHLGDINHHHHHPIQSPPVTPFQLGVPPIIPPTTQGQYANCSETPPFSAGPTTASSCQWSDAGVTSPDLQHFPPVYCLPSYPYINGEEQSGIHQLYSSDQNHELGMSLSADKKQPEWFSHTFDGQETVYAQIAQQIGNKGPKEYTFDNSNPNSFREKSQSH